jgi:outer membrane protein TolC
VEEFNVYWETAQAQSTKRKLLDAGNAAKHSLYDLEKRKRAPTLAWGGFFEMGNAPYVEGEEDNSSFTRPFNYKKAGVGLQLEGTFDWVGSRAKIHQAESEYYKVLLQKKTAVEGIELELREAYLDATNKHRLMDRSKEAQEISQQVVFLTKSNLDIGIGEKKDYTDALQSYLLFQGRYYEAVYNYNMAVVRLKQLSGRLGDEMRALLRKPAAKKTAGQAGSSETS